MNTIRNLIKQPVVTLKNRAIAPRRSSAIRNGRSLVVFVLVAIGAWSSTAAHAADPWMDPLWWERTKLTFLNSSQSSDLDNFPVLVSLDSSRIEFTKTQDLGEDIRFTDSDGTTLLKHEIERWDENGTCSVWVNVPKVDAASEIDYIWMYYDNAAATDNQDPAGVWDTNYAAVLHLSESPANGVAGHADSTQEAAAAISLVDITAEAGDTDVHNISNHSVSGSGKLLIVCVALETTDSDKQVDSVTWDQGGANEAMALYDAYSPSHGKLRLEVWYLFSPADGANKTARIELKNSNSQKIIAAAYTYNGVDQNISALGNWTENGGNDSAPGPITVPNTADSYVLDFAAKFENYSASQGADQTEHFDMETTGSFRAFGSSQEVNDDDDDDDDDGGGGGDSSVMSWSISGGDKENSHIGFTIAKMTPLNGTPNNFAGAAGSTTDATGMIGGAVELDGVDDHIDLGNPTEFDFGTSDWAISAWLKPASSGGSNRWALGKGRSGTGGHRWGLQLVNWEPITVTDDNSSTHKVYGGSTINDGQWHFISTRRTSTELKFYLDGVSTDTLTISSGYDLSGTSPQNAQIGGMHIANGDLRNFYDGLVDEVRISSTAHSDDWIAAQYLSMTDAFISWGSKQIKVVTWQEKPPVTSN